MGKKLTIDAVRLGVENRGGILISKEYVNAHSKLIIRCCKGHIFSTNWSNIYSNNRWCSVCAIKARAYKSRHSQSYIKNEIKTRFNCILLSTYETNKSLLELKCIKCGGTFNASWASLQVGDKKCLHGKVIKKYTFEEVQRVIKSKGGTVLDTEYFGRFKRIKIQCDTCNYMWSPLFDSVLTNHWCPECSRGKSQKFLSKIISEIFQDKTIVQGFKKFEWLKTSKGGKQELDIWVPELKLAIEYDGEQHFRPVCFGGMDLKQAKQNFKKQKQRDNLKNKKILNHPDDIKYFVRIRYDEPLTVEHITSRLIEVGAIKEISKNE